MGKYNPDDQAEFKKYTQFVNSELIRIDAKNFDGEAVFADFVKKEREFQVYLSNSNQWDKICDAFFDQYNNESMLQAKSFFRERVGRHKTIFDAIRTKDKVKFNNLKLNFMFFQHARESLGGKFHLIADRMFKELEKMRENLAVNALPIAVARGKMFYDKTPKGQLSLMDCISIANAGLLKGMDKYDGTNGYRGAKTTAIISMRGYLIKEYSATWMSLFPFESRVLYKCRSIMGKTKININDMPALTKAVNDSFAQDKLDGIKSDMSVLTESFLYELLMSTNNAPITGIEEEGRGYVEAFASVADETKDIPQNYEDNEEMKKVVKSSNFLRKIERKVLKLRGIGL